MRIVFCSDIMAIMPHARHNARTIYHVINKSQPLIIT